MQLRALSEVSEDLYRFDDVVGALDAFPEHLRARFAVAFAPKMTAELCDSSDDIANGGHVLLWRGFAGEKAGERLPLIVFEVYRARLGRGGTASEPTATATPISEASYR